MSHKSTVEAAAEHHAHDHDDLIVAPKGTSKLRFLLILSLTIFVLLIFTVGSQVESGLGSMFGGGGRDETYMSWVDPDTGEKFEIDNLTFQTRMQVLNRLASARSYAPLRWRENPGRARVEAEDAAMFYILDHLAKAAGIEVSDGEFRQQLIASFGNSQNLLMSARRLGVTSTKLEDDIREVMRGQKFKNLLLLGVGVADSDVVQTLWDEAHPEFAFEYAVTEAADFEDEARTELPDDEALLAWYRALPPFRQRQQYTEDRVLPILATVPLESGFDATALLAAYPPAEDVDAEAAARNYYNMNSYVRFPVKKDEDTAPEDTTPEDTTPEDTTPEDTTPEDTTPEDATPEDATPEDATPEDATPEDATPEDTETEDTETEDTETEDTETEDTETEDTETETQDEPERLYLEFEEVTDVCMIEAPIQTALGEFLTDVKKRSTAGEEVDFSAEAVALGLTVVAPEQPLSRSEIEETEGWGGRFAAGQLMAYPAGTWLPRVVLEAKTMVVGRIVEKKPGEEPPIAEMRDALLEEWVTDRSRVLAVEKLEAVRDAFGERPTDETEAFLPTVDSEAFAAAVTAAGFEIVQRPYMERLEIPNDDFEAASPGDMHIRGNALYHDLEPGQVPAATANAQGDSAYLVRLVGERPAPIDEIKPAELLRLRDQAISDARERFERRCFFPDSDYVKERYELVLRDNEATEETEPESDEP